MFLRWVAVLVFVATACIGGCDCSSTMLAGDVVEFVIPPAETVGTPCSESAPCDDGEPCNGVETCSPETGRCVGGELVADFTQCTTPDGRYASCVDGVCDLNYEEMFVPAGPFVMGVDSGSEDFGCMAPPPTPKRIVTVSGFFVDRYEVTNRRFKRCQRVGGCPADHIDGSFLRSDYFGDSAFDDYPLLYLFGPQAMDYCSYEGKRLPTEPEWEKAARGGCEIVPPDSCGEEDERLVPWDSPPLGDYRYSCREANIPEWASEEAAALCPGDTSRVGHYALGRSPYGADDMIGNVMERTADCFADYEACPGGCIDPGVPCDASLPPLEWNLVTRGGSFICSGSLTHREIRGGFEADPTVGFRCVRPMLEGGTSAKTGDRARLTALEGGQDHDGRLGTDGIASGSIDGTLGMGFARGGHASAASLSSRRRSTSGRGRWRPASLRGTTPAVRRRCARFVRATRTSTTSRPSSGTR
ncbi:MAG: SUMF1/EgtB/PvdO family nonheme iron enzyme [Deltaproteobacteria bacterium]|nr:SUMF1/EgtB/PvdO family nonheme iron enzyme [Deltaproteobacteria bacterium]